MDRLRDNLGHGVHRDPCLGQAVRRRVLWTAQLEAFPKFRHTFLSGRRYIPTSVFVFLLFHPWEVAKFPTERGWLQRNRASIFRLSKEYGGLLCCMGVIYGFDSLKTAPKQTAKAATGHKLELTLMQWSSSVFNFGCSVLKLKRFRYVCRLSPGRPWEFFSEVSCCAANPPVPITVPLSKAVLSSLPIFPTLPFPLRKQAIYGINSNFQENELKWTLCSLYYLKITLHLIY